MYETLGKENKILKGQKGEKKWGAKSRATWVSKTSCVFFFQSGTFTDVNICVPEAAYKKLKVLSEKSTWMIHSSNIHSFLLRLYAAYGVFDPSSCLGNSYCYTMLDESLCYHHCFTTGIRPNLSILLVYVPLFFFFILFRLKCCYCCSSSKTF